MRVKVYSATDGQTDGRINQDDSLFFLQSRGSALKRYDAFSYQNHPKPFERS